MRTFVIKTIPYLLVAVGYLVWGEYYLFINRENIPIEWVAQTQLHSNQETYYGRQILGNSLSFYKRHRMLQNQPEILVLGQSVALQFRDFMFEPHSDDFYNTGLMARNANDLHYIADLIQQGDLQAPRWIVLAVDMTLFQEITFLDESEWLRNPAPDRAMEVSSHLKGMQRILNTPEFRQKPHHALGFGRAGMHGIGYRRDGSYRHEFEINRYLKDSTYYDGAPLVHFREKTGPFEQPLSFDPNKASLLMQALDRFAEANIPVTLYFPPLSDQFFQLANKEGDFVRFWEQYLGFEATCQQRGMTVIPFCTPSQMGLTDDYMVDADHPGEVLVGFQLQQWYAGLDSTQRAAFPTLTFETLETQKRHPNWIPLSWMVDSLDQAAARSVQTPTTASPHLN
jgi:hypothetical protein